MPAPRRPRPLDAADATVTGLGEVDVAELLADHR